MKKQIIAILIALVVVTCLAVSVLSDETKEINEDLQCYEGVILKLNEALKPAKEITSLTDTKDIIKTTGTSQQDWDFIEWATDTLNTEGRYSESLTLAFTSYDMDSSEFWFGEIYRYTSERLVEIDKFDVSPALQPVKNVFKKYLQDTKQGAYYSERGAKNLDFDDIDTSITYLESATEHLKNATELLEDYKKKHSRRYRRNSNIHIAIQSKPM